MPLSATLTTTNHLDIPQELLDRILEQLQNDLASLKSTNLVSQSWHTATQRYLFRTLRFAPQNSTELDQKLRLLSSPLVVFARKLILEETMVFRDRGFLHNNDVFVESMAPRLTELHLVETTFDAFEDITFLISSFGQLRTIILKQVAWLQTSSDRDSLESRPFPPLVNGLRIWDCKQLRPFLAWMSAQPRIPRISHMEMGPILGSDHATAGLCFFHLAPYMEHLALAFPPSMEGFGVLQEASPKDAPKASSVGELGKKLYDAFGYSICPVISTFKRLRHIHLHAFVDSSQRYQTSAEVWGPTLITSAAKTVQTVRFTMRLGKAGELDSVMDVKWDFYDEVFTSTEFRMLERVEFEVEGKANVEGVEGLLTARLPQTSAKGLLRVFRNRSGQGKAHYGGGQIYGLPCNVI